MPNLARASGILAHPTSLPGPHGIGDMVSARGFLDFLAEAGQTIWQVLPLTPTGFGDSPYASPSALAGNPLLVGLERLMEQGLLTGDDVAELRALPFDRVDFARLAPAKTLALRTAFARFTEGAPAARRSHFDQFREEEAFWLDDFTLFTALHEAEGTAWNQWAPGLRDRKPAALAEARKRLADEVGFHAFGQFLFFEQWGALREEAHARGIQIVGDIPIFVAYDSADVWAHRSLFKLDKSGAPRVVAGVPPDYFSQTGQLWGNPLYDWGAMARDGYAWWVARFQQLLRLVDVVRVDHFRGFQSAWEVPAGATTAEGGTWVDGPGAALFRAVDAALGERVPVIAEDLGLITDEVRELLTELGYPGMKVLQFAFGGDARHPYLPHMFQDARTVCYTGTHDNDTTRGWYASAGESERDAVRRYAAASGEDIAWDVIRLAEGSVADWALVPLQDVLDLGSEARMNTPGQAEGNWQWRAKPGALSREVAHRLREVTATFGRIPMAATDDLREPEAAE